MVWILSEWIFGIVMNQMQLILPINKEFPALSCFLYFDRKWSANIFLQYLAIVFNMLFRIGLFAYM